MSQSPNIPIQSLIVVLSLSGVHRHIQVYVGLCKIHNFASNVHYMSQSPNSLIRAVIYGVYNHRYNTVLGSPRIRTARKLETLQ